MSTLVVVPATPAAFAATKVVTVGGYDAARTTDTLGLYDACGSGLQGILTDPASFGSSGTVVVDFDLAAAVNTVTSAGDLAGVDVFFTGFVQAMSTAEQGLLYDFVLDGGSLVMTPDDHRYATETPSGFASHTGQSLFDLFGVGVTYIPSGGSPNTALPPFSDGPFGAPGQYSYGGNHSAITPLGPNAISGGTNSSGDPSLAYIPHGALGPGSGAVVVAGDVDFFTDPSCAGSAAPPGGGSVGNATLIKNIFAWVATSASSLQDAIDAAAPGDTITLAAGIYHEQITIDKNLILEGVAGDAAAVVIDGSGFVPGGLASTVTVASGVTVTIRDLTIRDGTATDGGGVYNSGDLTLEGVVVTGNAAGAEGGGIYSGSGGSTTLSGVVVSDNSASRGGGIYVDSGGSATVLGSTIADNTASNGAGAYLEAGGQLRIGGGTLVTGNSASIWGSAVYANATIPSALVLDNATFDDNDLVDKGGALAVFTSTCSALCAVIDGSRFYNNDAGNGGGAAWIVINGSAGEVWINNTEFDQNSASAIGGGEGGAILKEGDGLLTIQASTFTNNFAGYAGGAFTNWDGPTRISGSTFSTNEADPDYAIGGAISHQWGDLTIRGSSFVSNRSGGDGGAIHNSGIWAAIIDSQISDNWSGADNTFAASGAAGDGAGIWSDATLAVRGSTFSGNSALNGSGGGLNTSGGGLVETSTFSSNSATGAGGGGVYVGLTPSAPFTTFNAVTITDNTAGFGGGVYAPTTAPIEVWNSIIQGNTAGSGPDCFDTGALINFFSSIVGVLAGCPGFTSPLLVGNLPPGTDPLLGALLDNGGPSLTHALPAGSPAIDAGVSSRSVEFPGFAALGAPLSLNGGPTGAAIVDEGGGQFVLRTHAPTWASGSAFVENAFSTVDSFSTSFEFQIEPLTLFGGQPGDGFTFAVVERPTFLGDAGGRLGLGAGVGNSSNQQLVAVEFDVYGADRVGIDVGADVSGDSTVPDVARLVADAFPGRQLQDNTSWYAWIDYDAPAGTLEVRLSDTPARPVDAFLSYPVDIAEQIGSSAGYFGFTGASAAATANFDILNWTLTSTLGTDQRGVARPQGTANDIGAYESPYSQVFATEYAMPNGYAGFFDYRDDTYTGGPYPGGDPLSGGLGELTDGVVATQNWNIVEIGPGSTPQPGPYVGWWNTDPTITFTFDGLVDLDAIVLYADDSNNYLGVKTPASVEISIGGTNQVFPVTDPATAHPISIPVDVSAFSPSNTVTLTVHRQVGGINDDWVFLSEVEFFGSLLPAPPDVANFAYDVTPGTAEVGVAEVPIIDIPIEAIVGTSGADYESAPLGSIPLGSIPLGSIDLNASPLGSIPLGSIPLGSIGLAGTPLGSIPLGSIPLGSIGGWAAVLSGSALDGALLQDVTLTDVYALPDANTRLAGIDLNDISIEGSPLGSISLPSIALAGEPVESIDPTQALCDDPALATYDCTTKSLLQLEAAGAPIGSIPLGSIPLGSIPLGSIPLGSIPLGSIPLGSIPLGSIPLGSIPLGSIPLGSIDLAGTPLGSIPLGSIGTSGACDLLVPPDDCTTLGLDGTDTLFDLAVALEGAGSTLGSTPLGSIPLGSIPLGSIPLGSIDLLGAPLGSIPLGSIPLGSIPLGSIPLGSIPLGSIPLGSIGTTGACDLLVAPLDCVTLGVPVGGSLLDLVSALEGVGEGLSSTPLGSIPLGSIPLGSIPLGSIPLGSIPLGSIPLGSIDLAKSPLGSIPLGSIDVGDGFADTCAYLAAAGGGYDCGSLGVNNGTLLWEYLAAVELAIAATETLGSTPLGSIPLGSIPLGSIPLGSIDLDVVEINNAPLGSIPLGSIGLGEFGLAASPLGSIPLGSIPLGSINTVVDCGLVDCTATSTDTLADAVYAGAIQPDATLGDLGVYGTMTLGQLDDLLTMELLYGATELGTSTNDYGNLTLGQILVSLLLQSDFPWETLPLADLGLQEIAPNSVVTYSASFDLTGNGTGLAGTLTATMPPQFYFRPGTAVLLTGGVEGTVSPLVDPAITELPTGEVELTFDLTLDAGDSYAVEWEAVPGFHTGTFVSDASVDFTAAIPTPTGPVADDAEITVTEAFTGNNDFGSPQSITEDTLVFSHIATAGASDFFEFPAGGAGTRIAVFVSQFDQDTDLVLYKPATEPVSAVAPRSVPLGSIPIEDDGVNYGGNQTEEPELEADIDILPAPLGSISINRGTTPESAETTLLAAPLDDTEPFTIQISGYQGLASSSPYVVRVKVDQDVTAPACTPYLSAAIAGGPTLDVLDLPADLNTIFLMSWQRLAHEYGVTAANDILASVNALIGDGANGVVGAVVPVDSVDGNTAVGQAYAAWDANPCDADLANEVVSSITALVEQIQAAHPTLAYVTIIGNDTMIPFARLDDLTAIANEDTYTEGFTDDALYGSLLTRHYLSDDPYGDLDPIPWLDRLLYVPELAVGRLLEDPTDIVQALDNFVTFNGTLDPQTAFVAGYDFLDDGTTVVRDRLANIYGASNTASLIDLTFPQGADTSGAWTKADLLAALDLSDGTPGSDTADIFSVNAHSDHYRQLPSYGDANNDESDLFEVGDLGPLPLQSLVGDIIFTMGCHAGLSVSDIGVGAAVPSDWAQAYSALGALYVANSGYGYGDTSGVALSERLMAEFAENVDGTMSAAQALTFAKQEYFAQLGQYTVYDEKAMQQVIFYGLPMYSLGTTPPPAPPPPLPTAVDPGTSLDAASIGFAPTYETNTTAEGTYYSIDGQTQQTHYRPTQPLDTLDITQDGLLAHGAIVTEATTTDFGGVDPVYFRPNVTGALEREPEVPSDEIATPVFGLNIATYNRPGTGPSGEPFEQAQELSIISGAFLSPADGSQLGTQRLTDNADLKVFYAPPASSDFQAPRIRSVDSVLVGNQVSFTVDTTDIGGIAQVIALYRNTFNSTTGVSTWISTNLPVDTGSVYSGGGPVQPSGIVNGLVDFKIWVIDTSGNVATTDFKNVFWQAASVPPPTNTATLSLSIEQTPPAAPSPWYDGPATVTVTGVPGVTYTYSGPGGLSGTGSGPSFSFAVTNDGVNVITISGGGETGSIVVLIDSTPPGVPVIAAPAPLQVFEQDTPATYDFSCPDVGSGAVTCTGEVVAGTTVIASGVVDGDLIDLATPGEYTLQVTGTDIFGRSTPSPARTFYVVKPLEIDGLAPVALGNSTTFTASVSDVLGVSTTAGVTLTWGDETTETPAPSGPAAGVYEISGSHAYGAVGVYPVTVSVTHDNGYVQTAFAYAVVYDPAEGFVTGGGWIDSPVGAYRLDPSLTGKANFGFVSKYKKGATVPTGTTQFKFKAADFEFHSTSYDWLVIAGSKAQYKGHGLANGQLAPNGEEYTFMLTGFDADVNQNDEHEDDRFRIKIWYEVAGAEVIVYDNCVGCAEDIAGGDAEAAAMTTVLGGGSIQIHKGKGPK